MAIKARFGTFETNSSSTHSIVMCTLEEYEKFRNGELFRRTWRGDGFVTKDEAYKTIKEDAYYSEDEIKEMETNDDLFVEAAKESDIYDFDSFGNDYETFYEEYTTPNGETVVAFGYYGYDC